mmetsp:Transcript_4981/g.15739  ORF Transcript_4981/g.15739 Transcript_4981/m.15739 type:complete len:82 (-) Transcript_4981:29-274(-)
MRSGAAGTGTVGVAGLLMMTELLLERPGGIAPPATNTHSRTEGTASCKMTAVPAMQSEASRVAATQLAGAPTGPPASLFTA